MIVDRLRGDFRGASHDMELIVWAHPKPNVAAVLERFGYFFEAHDLFVEFHTFREVSYVDRDVIEFWRLTGSRLRNGQGSAQHECQGQDAGNPRFRHSDASYNAQRQRGTKMRASVTFCMLANPTEAAELCLRLSQ